MFSLANFCPDLLHDFSDLGHDLLGKHQREQSTTTTKFHVTHWGGVILNNNNNNNNKSGNMYLNNFPRGGWGEGASQEIPGRFGKASRPFREVQ